MKFNYEYMENIYVYIRVSIIAYCTHRVHSQCTVATLPLAVSATGTPGYLTSPNYPSNYDSYATCEWLITGPDPSDRIIINIEEVEIEYSVTCGYDVLQIYDGNSNEATLLASLCSSNADTFNAYVSTTDSLYIVFTTDLSTVDKGFNILHFIADPSIQYGCGSPLIADSTPKYMRSPNLPATYSANYGCTWSFTTAESVIKFTMIFLDLQSTSGCTKASLTIYDGSSNAATVLSTQCTTAETYTFSDIQSTGNTAFVDFTTSSDAATTFYGFLLKYESVVITTTSTTQATTTLAAASSSECSSTAISLTAALWINYITSVNYGVSTYENNMRCKWLITAPTNYAVEAQLTGTFSIEYNSYCSYDSISLYDGDSTSSALLNRFCGYSRVDNAYSSTGVNMLVYFSTDGSVLRNGFQLQYKAADITYPACKAAYTAYTATATIQTISVASPYSNNVDEYFLIENPTGGDLVLQLTVMDVELAHGCIYDKILIYNGSCSIYDVLHTHCGKFLKHWDLTGTSYLVQFHSDGSVTGNGFTMQYYLGLTTTAAPTTTTTTVGPPIEVEINLINEVLTNYSSENLPVRDLSGAISASVDMSIVGINDVDEVAQKLTTTMLFEITWKDDFLAWDTTKKLGIKRLLIPQDDMWKPDFALINGFDTITAMGASFMFVVVQYDGTCTWKPYQIMESVCQMDMSDYPYDTQSCDLKFSTWSATSDQVLTTIGENGITKHSSFIDNSEWTLLTISQKNDTVDGQVIAVFTFVMKRNHSFVIFYVALPIVMLSLLSAIAFVLPVASGEKMGFGITVFLSFVVYVIVTFQKMPENSDTLSLFAIYVLSMTCVSALVVMVSSIQLRLVDLDNKKKRLPASARTFTKAILYIQNKLLCSESTKEETIPDVDNDEANNENTTGREEDNTDANSESDDISWEDFVTVLDFVFFIIFMLSSLGGTFYFLIYLSIQ